MYLGSRPSRACLWRSQKQLVGVGTSDRLDGGAMQWDEEYMLPSSNVGVTKPGYSGSSPYPSFLRSRPPFFLKISWCCCHADSFFLFFLLFYRSCTVLLPRNSSLVCLAIRAPTLESCVHLLASWFSAIVGLGPRDTLGQHSLASSPGVSFTVWPTEWPPWSWTVSQLRVCTLHPGLDMLETCWAIKA